MRKKKTWMLVLTAVIVCGISSFLYISSHPNQMNTKNADAGAAFNALQFKVTKEDLVNSH